ncbi:Enoyl-CoA hydratase/isomerase [Desulfofundulus australicus DSM 11792]|uniref:Enoyl-CoA hydratase/isomerase n=1 Tax=Desulfofundulus australicus DSM 11792 TaxID=1121425 RepID=A0A1M5CJY8_9FIRM|nr:enoyl-CoA hydratase-related protein [Desulfofundulus australicus]SHF54917.1 Enoyl-CoA hydratase/isomerase [Desulfofundulus australicus DSM 11792]
MYETILFEVNEGVATVTLNRPASLNSINRQMVAELRDALFRVQGDPGVRCMVLTGAGRGFCAGADLRTGVVRRAGF